MKFDQGRALIIGIANYKHVRKLPSAVLNDARDTAEILRSPAHGGYPDANVKVLIDGDATLDGIRAALADLVAIASEDDTVAIVFSGHGARLGTGDAATSALVPYDCDLADLEGTTLGEAELSAAIAAIKASRVIVVIDACHAAGTATLKSGMEGEGHGFVEGFEDKSLRTLAKGTGRVIFASSRATETSIVLRGARNSVFTTAMLAGLNGDATPSDDGTVRVFDLFNSVSEAVRKTAPGAQHPVFKASDLEENFPVALARGGTKSISPAAGPGRDLEQIMPDLYPLGPTDQDIWQRAGGDVSRLNMSGTGRARWFAALRTLSLGGGGAKMSRESLIEAALEEFPNHRELDKLR